MKAKPPTRQAPRNPLVNWVAKALHMNAQKVQLRFCTDKNSCSRKTFKRMHTKPKYYVVCFNQSTCTMQSVDPVTVDLSRIDVPDRGEAT